MPVGPWGTLTSRGGACYFVLTFAGGPLQDQGQRPLLSVLIRQCWPTPAAWRETATWGLPGEDGSVSWHKQRRLPNLQLNQVSPGSVGSGSSWPGWPGPGFKSQDGLAGERGPGQASGTTWLGPGWSPCDFPGHRAHSVSCAGPQASAMLLSPHPDPPVGIPSRPPQPTGPGVCSVPAEIMCPGQGSRRGPPPRP